MDALLTQLLAIVRGMWRRRWIGLLVAWIVGIVGAVGLLRIPDRFEASARVYVDTKSVLKPLMRDLTVEPDIDQTIGLLARTLITRPNVELLMRKARLDSQIQSQFDRDQLVESLIREIKLTGSGRDNVFSFSYRDTSPERARLVVENLVSLFVDADLGAKVRDGEAARTFIDQQIKTYEARLAEAETRRKDFKLRNLEVNDTAGKDYFSRIGALTDELGKLTLELRAAEQSRDALKHELSGETASLLPAEVTAAAPVAQTPEIDARLETQRKLLDELLRRYTDLHPDVVTTKKLIARLEEQKQQELDARRRAEQSKPVRASAAAVDPVFQRVKLALAEAEATIAALRVRVSDAQSRLGQLRASANRVPQVEAELAQLNRDYDVIRRNYEAMVGRREKASLSEDVDATRLANFRVIEPPRTAPQPVFPNRLVLAPMLLLAALGAGLVSSYLASQLFPTFDNARQLGSISRRPILGSVSMLMTDGMIRRSRFDAVALGLALAGLVLVYGGWIAWMAALARA